MRDKALKKYLHAIISYSRSSPKKTKKLVSELKESIIVYIQEHPGYQMADIISIFGSPEEIALSFLTVSDLKYINKKFQIKKSVLITLLAILIIYIVGFTTFYIQSHRSIVYYRYEQITEEH